MCVIDIFSVKATFHEGYMRKTTVSFMGWSQNMAETGFIVGDR